MEHPLRVVRKAAGLTQAELGLELGVTESRVCQVETRPGASFRPEVWLVVAEKFPREMKRAEVTLKDLLRGECA